MPQLVCPLCGRFVSLRTFDPASFDMDVYVVKVQGLGRGRGVKVADKNSILQPGHPTIAAIRQRLLQLTRVLLAS